MLGGLWALPCSLIGLLLATPLLLRRLAGRGSVRRVGRTLELAWHQGALPPGHWLRHWPFAALTLGHVVLGESGEALDRLRAHEAVHVRQYERWGPLFLLAYPLASALAWARGDCPYRGNRFERPALAAEATAAQMHAVPAPPSAKGCGLRA